MKSKLFSNLLKKSFLKKASVKDEIYRYHNAKNHNISTSGFTLIEVLVVIVMVGILSAIAAPSWLAFVERQKLNKANDSILAALQEAQRKAKNTKFYYNVSFTNDSDGPKVAIHPGNTEPDSYWRSLGRDSGVNTEKFLIGTNIEGRNTKKIISYKATFDNKKPQTITFNHIGILESTDNTPSDTGLKVILAIPKLKTPTQPSDIKRCVIIETLIGGIRTVKNDGCD